MDYWDKYFGNTPVFQIAADEEDVEEFRSEKSVTSGGKVAIYS